MKKKFLILMFFIPLGIFAQVKQEKQNAIFDSNKIPLNISYYGNLVIHPGIKIGADWNLLMIHKTKEKKRKTKVIRKILYVSPNVAFYYHNNSNIGIIPSAEVGWRRYNNKLFYREVDFGLGYFHKFNMGETWEVTNDKIEKKISSSRGYFTPSLSVAFGKVFLRKEKEPVTAFVKINANNLLHYNANSVLELSFELGFKFYTNKFFKRKIVKTIYKIKKRKK